MTDVIQASLPILAYDAAAAQWHARERARLEGIGQRRPLQDSTIAAVAASRGLILVTRNTQDFAAFRGLHLKNWFEADAVGGRLPEPRTAQPQQTHETPRTQSLWLDPPPAGQQTRPRR